MPFYSLLIFVTVVQCAKPEENAISLPAKSCRECPIKYPLGNSCGGDCEWAIYSEKDYICVKRCA